MNVMATSDSTTPVLAAQAVSAASQSSAGSSSSSGISMSDFMKILAAELQYQDPLSDSSSGGGSSNSDYITQMVEYNLLSQVESMTSQMKFASAPAALGQTAMYSATDSSGNVTYPTGTVTAVDLSGDNPAYLINGVWVDQSSIFGFYKSASDSGTAAQDA